MGLLKKMVTNAVSDGIRKGVGNAIGKAVEQAVAPAAERLVNKQAEAIDAAANEINKGLSQTQAAASEARVSASQAANSLGGLAGLESALSGFTARAEQLATQMSAQVKICPSCGEGSTADKTFCPHCGAKLPDTTLGQDYTCTKCGAVNTPGTKYCASCGTILPGAEAAIKAQKAKDDQVLAQFDSLLPQYPKWNVGGNEFRLEESDNCNGFPVYRLSLAGGKALLDNYIAQLKQAGFTQAGDEYWKTINGVCRAFSATDACSDGGINVSYYVGTFDKKPEPKPAADPLADLKGAAKGLFKNILK